VNQQSGHSQGNANPTLYSLYRLQSLGGPSVFHDVVSGGNSVPGTAGFSAGPGYDQATGLGSPDVFTLVQHWNDPAVPGQNGPSGGAGSTTHFALAAPPSATAGASFQVTVTALDSNNAVAANYSDPVHFTSTDPVAVLPADITLTNGSGTVSIVLVSAGTRMLTASDPLNSSIAGSSGSITLTAAAGLRFIPVTPCRVADTRNASGPLGGPGIAAGATRSFAVPSSPCVIPGTAQAYSFNVAVVPAAGSGSVTVWPSGQTQPPLATMTFSNGQVKSTAAIVPAGSGGAVSVFASAAADTILDINGYFVAAADPSGLAFYPLSPCRLTDTRLPAAPLNGPALTGSATRTLPVLSSNCLVAPTARAYSLNLTAVPQGPVGYLTAFPTGASRPLVATLNDVTATVSANAAIVPAGVGGSIDVYATNYTDLVVDINGYFAPAGPGGLSLYIVAPCRVLDTRQVMAVPMVGPLDLNVLGSECGGTPSAQAYLFDATVAPVGQLGFLTLWPQGAVRPRVATLNDMDGTITNNLAIVPTYNTAISAYATNGTQLTLDLLGYFAP